MSIFSNENGFSPMTETFREMSVLSTSLFSSTKCQFHHLDFYQNRHYLFYHYKFFEMGEIGQVGSFTNMS